MFIKYEDFFNMSFTVSARKGKSSQAKSMQAPSPLSRLSIWHRLVGDLTSIFEPGIRTLPPYLKPVFTSHMMIMMMMRVVKSPAGGERCPRLSLESSFAFKDTVLALLFTFYFLENIFRLRGPNGSTRITATLSKIKQRHRSASCLYSVMLTQIESPENDYSR